MKNLQSNLMFITLEEKWGYSLLDFMFGEQVREENQMKKDLLKSCESERSKIKRENYHSDDPVLFFRDLATACRGRAYRSNKFKCTITKEDLLDLYEKQNHKCALSGIEMTTIKEKGRLPNNASVDRINPGKDYSIDNIRLVCNHVNMMRSDLSDEELLKYCKAIVYYVNRT